MIPIPAWFLFIIWVPHDMPDQGPGNTYYLPKACNTNAQCLYYQTQDECNAAGLKETGTRNKDRNQHAGFVCIPNQ